MKIFVSYRREDSIDPAGRLHDALVKEFGARSVCFDVDSIPPGVDFRRHLREQLASCDVALVMIGDVWVHATDSKGTLRLSQPEDFVRIEVEEALRRGCPVIPVLINNTTMPEQDQLPDSIKDLCYRNAVRLRPNPDFHHDVNRLMQGLKALSARDWESKSEKLVTGKDNKKLLAIGGGVAALLLVGILAYALTRPGTKPLDGSEAAGGVERSGKVWTDLDKLNGKLTKYVVYRSLPDSDKEYEKSIESDVVPQIFVAPSGAFYVEYEEKENVLKNVQGKMVSEAKSVVRQLQSQFAPRVELLAENRLWAMNLPIRAGAERGDGHTAASSTPPAAATIPPASTPAATIPPPGTPPASTPVVTTLPTVPTTPPATPPASANLPKVEIKPGAKRVNVIGMTMVALPAAEYMMGSIATREDVADFIDFAGDLDFNGEKPQHRVKFSRPFEMSMFEVTRGQFRRFVEEENYKTTGETGYKCSGWDDAAADLVADAKYNWQNPGFEQTDDHPAILVSWDDAVRFCKWLTKKDGHRYRLPTEAEWEYACRAGSTTFFYTTNNPDELATVANIADVTFTTKFKGWIASHVEDKYVFTAPVGSFKPNAFGLHDMHGNVCEWCSDFYDSTYYASSPTTDPQGAFNGTSRVARGGGWQSEPVRCRSTFRGARDSGIPGVNCGFRVVSVQ